MPPKHFAQWCMALVFQSISDCVQRGPRYSFGAIEFRALPYICLSWSDAVLSKGVSMAAVISA